MASKAQISQYHDRGYFIVDDAVDAALLQELAAAADRVAARVRSGEVVDDPDGIHLGGEAVEPAFISGLVAPEFAEPAFAQYLASEPIARYLQSFLGDELRMGWVHLCCVQGQYVIGWHRDTGGQVKDGSYEEEMEILGRHRKHFMKWHMALVDDPCLWIVPGSQNRFRTDREHEALQGGSGEIPGATRIDLRKGQTIFWNGNSIHRGVMPEAMKRRSTLMGGMIDHRSDYDPGEKGDHRWLLADNIRPGLPERAQRYYDNWRSLAEPRMAAAPPA